jgi:hypothetical protein
VIQKPMQPKTLGESLMSFMEAYSRGDILDSKFGQFECIQHLRPENSVMTTYATHTISDPQSVSPLPSAQPAVVDPTKSREKRRKNNVTLCPDTSTGPAQAASGSVAEGTPSPVGAPVALGRAQPAQPTETAAMEGTPHVFA